MYAPVRQYSIWNDVPMWELEEAYHYYDDWRPSVHLHILAMCWRWPVTSIKLWLNWYVPCSKVEPFSWCWMEKEPMAATVKWTTTRNCTRTDVVKHHFLHPETRSFIYAEDLCITSQGKYFHNIEATQVYISTEFLDTFKTTLTQLHPNPSKTQICAFHLRNIDATPMYIGNHLDRTLSYKMHN